MTGTTSAPAEQPVTFRLWGAVEARKSGEPVGMGSPREQCMLVGLIAANGKDIQRATLKKWIWDDEPVSASSDLDGFMTRLRKRLEDLGFDRALINGNGLCRLAIPPSSVDVHLVKALMAAPKGDDHHAAELLGQAVRLSDGEPLAGLNSRRIDNYRIELVKERHALRIAYYQAEARLGRYREHLGELNRLFDEHPGDDAVTALTMYALHFAGHRPGALEVCHKHILHLRNKVGIDVSAKIGDLQQQVLDGALAKDSFAVGKPYQANGEPPMDSTKPLVLAIRPDTGDLEELRQAVAGSFGEGELRTRLADDCLICVVLSDVEPVRVVRAWMDRLVGAVRQRAQVGIAIGDEDRVRELAKSEYARRVLNGAPRGSNLVITVSDDLYELVTGFPGGQLDATGYRRAENGVGGWVRVPGLSTPPHPRDDESGREAPASASHPSGPHVEFHGKTRIGKQTIASVINKGRR
jgi:DNA-binding SARP family transcriptional activator